MPVNALISRGFFFTGGLISYLARGITLPFVSLTRKEDKLYHRELISLPFASEIMTPEAAAA